MAWVEMIDYMTGHYPPEQFKVPFTTWRDIIRKIEEKFIIKEWSQYMYTNWLGNLKKAAHLKTIHRQFLEAEIAKLDSNNNYWVVIVWGKTQRSKNHVYDCHVEPMKTLIKYAPADFYIADKRYNWLTYFEMDSENDQVLVYKSGDGQTPFDRD